MRVITLPLYELHELSTDAYYDALKSIRNVRLELFVKHDLPELIKELLSISHAYGFIFQFSQLNPFTKNKHVIMDGIGFRNRSHLERSEMVARFNAVYLQIPSMEPDQEIPTFRQILGEYTKEHGRVDVGHFMSFFVRAMNSSAQQYIETVEKTIDSDVDSITFAKELGYEFTERGDIFDHYVKGGDYHVIE